MPTSVGFSWFDVVQGRYAYLPIYYTLSSQIIQAEVTPKGQSANKVVGQHLQTENETNLPQRLLNTQLSHTHLVTMIMPATR